ncbi:MAG: hypothetical protein U1F76_29805 [Candidatus Competibacteraceae bacterium]
MLYWLSAFMFLLASQAAFGTLLYEYIGTPVGSNVIPIFSPTDNVSGYFIFPAPVPSGNYSGDDFIDYGVQIGGLSLNKAQGAEGGAHFVFDANYQPISWSFVIAKYIPSEEPSLIEVWANSSDLPPGLDQVLVYYRGSTRLGAVALPGKWVLQTTTVAEPTINMMLILGLIVFLFNRRGEPLHLF